MKLAFALLASGLLAISACKSSNHLESETASANGKRNLVPKDCRNQETWNDIGCETDPMTKQLRSRQVVVLRLLKIDESLKKDLASRKPSLELCAGWVLGWHLERRCWILVEWALAWSQSIKRLFSWC